MCDGIILINTKSCKILIELGFIDNDSVIAKWDTDKIVK